MPGMIKYLRKKRLSQIIANIGDLWNASNSLLMHFDNTLNDEMGHVVTNSGVTTSATQSVFGGYSGYFNGSSHLSVAGVEDFRFGSGNWTVEGRIYPTVISGIQNIAATWLDSSVGNRGWQFYLNGSTLTVNLASGSTIYTATVDGVVASEWQHVSVCCYNHTVTVYLDGIGGTPVSGVGTLDATTMPLCVGGNWMSSGGSVGNRFVGYIDELRITKGLARYIDNFTVPTTAFPNPTPIDLYFDNNVLLMQMDNSAVDVMGHAITNNGVTFDANTKKFGTGSAYFNGSAYLSTSNSTDFDFGSGNWTVECFANVSSLSTDRNIFWNGIDGNSELKLRIQSDGTLRFTMYYSSAYQFDSVSTATVSIGSWNYYAVVRNGSNYTVYLNGISVISATLASAIPWTSSKFLIGARIDTGTFPFLGYIDGFRVTKGVARYLSAFTPPGQPFKNQTFEIAEYDPYFDPTTLLCSFDGNTDDAKGHVLTNTDVTFSGAVRKFGTQSAAFNGTSSKLYMPTYSSDFYFGGGNYTVECLVNLAAIPTVRTSIVMVGTGTGTNWVNLGWALFIEANTGQVGFHMSYGSNIGPNLASSAGIATNTWYHIAVVRTASNLTTLYINGTVVATSSSSYGQGDNTTHRLTIGTGWTPYAYLNGYIGGIRITKGLARYTQAFKPIQLPFPNAGIATNNTVYDPYAKQTVMALHMDDATDYIGHTVTNVGPVLFDTNTKKFGTASACFDGNTYLNLADSNDWYFANQNFTVEFFAKRETFGTIQYLFGQMSAGGTTDFGMRFDATNAITVYATSALYQQATTAISNNDWHHYAIVRNGAYVKLYIDGIATNISISVGTGSLTNSTASFSIGRCGDYAANAFNGFIDNFRITKGVARYIYDFVPPTQSFITDGITEYAARYPLDTYLNDVALQIGFDGVAPADATNNFRFTNNGATIVTSQAANSGSGYFNGSSSQIRTESPLIVVNGDFTVDTWAMMTGSSKPSSAYICSCADRVAGGQGFYLYWNNTNGFVFDILDTASTDILLTQGADTVRLNTWQHVAATYTAATKTMALYVNGILVNTSVMTNSPSLNARTWKDTVGAYETNTGTFNQFWPGYIDQFRVTRAVRYNGNFTPSVN